MQLNKDVSLPNEGEELSTNERESVVGKVYSKIIETEFRLIPCRIHVIREPASTMEALATLVNIAPLDRPEERIYALPRILAATVGKSIKDVSVDRTINKKG